MSLVLLLSSFLSGRSPCQFSDTPYARSMSTADVVLKSGATKFNSEDDEEEIKSLMNPSFVLLCLWPEQWRIKNDFVWVSSQSLCHSLDSMVNQIILYARLITLQFPVNVSIYNAEIQQVFSASLGRWKKDPGCGWSRYHQESGWQKNPLGGRGGRVFCLVDVTNFVGFNSSQSSLAVAKNYLLYRGSKSNLPMKDATRFLLSSKYRRLSFTKKFGSRIQKKLFDG